MQIVALLCHHAVDTALGSGILMASFQQKIVTGHSMQPTTEGTMYAFGPAYGRVMALPHALSALGRDGPGGSAPDLASSTANDNRLTDSVARLA
jgi:hypothetical protein